MKSATSFRAIAGKIQKPSAQRGIIISNAKPRVLIDTIVEMKMAIASTKNEAIPNKSDIIKAVLKCPWKEIPGICGKTNIKTRAVRANRIRNLII
jgi:hypothetical protein